MKIINLSAYPVHLRNVPAGAARGPTFELGAAPDAAAAAKFPSVGVGVPHIADGADVAARFGVPEQDLPSLPAIKAAVDAGMIRVTGAPAKGA